MDGRRTCIERAFDLAQSGKYDKAADIRETLKREGYNIAQIQGPAMQKQIRNLILSAKRPSEVGA